MKKLLSVLGVIGLLAGCATQSSNNCSVPTTHTVSQPVEVIYRQTTYQTVYEPKTYATTRYVKKPYNNCTKAELCK